MARLFPPSFLDWTLPLADASAAFLLQQQAVAADGAIAGCADFEGHVVVVPTREAGRRLLVALTARVDAAGGGGVLPPLVVTPDECLHLIAGEPEDFPVASRGVSLLAMASVLRELKVSDFGALFPEPPPVRDWRWAEEFAVALLGVRGVLADAAEFHDFAAVSRHPENGEPQRWADLARIEVLFRERLKMLGFVDANDWRHTGAVARREGDGVAAQWKRVWLAGVPEPSPLLPVALERLPESVPVQALVAAPVALREGFDRWGRVASPEFWLQRGVEWEDFSRQVRVVASPGVLEDAVASLAGGMGEEAGRWLTVGILGRELAGGVERAVVRSGGEVHNPEGIAGRESELGALLALWVALLDGDEVRAVGGLLRMPFFVKAVAPGCGGISNVLWKWDVLCERHLPDSLRDAQAFAPEGEALAGVLAEVAQWRTLLLSENWAEVLRELLGRVFDAGDEALATALECVFEETTVLESVATTGRFRLGAGEWLGLVLRRLAMERVSVERSSAGAVPVLGWLELLWEDAPHLVVAGLNEGWVPETVGGDAFLPGSFRVKLGLPSDEARVAAGVYVLQKLLAQRAGGRGRVDVFVLQADGQENPLRPSRLLFLGAGAGLPARVHRLFAEPAVALPEPSWVAGWRLVPSVPGERLRELEGRLSVTGFRDYLDCPFRFYLRHVLGMQGGRGEAKFEPDAREFGAMIHGALEAFARDETVRDSTDADGIADFVHGRLEAFLTHTYGRHWPLPVVVAAESARNRLGAFAHTQARLRAEGWRVMMGEISFDDLLGEGRVFRLDENGAAVAGKIDRVDFHEKLGWRILDYKTAASAVFPDEAHLVASRENAGWPPAFARMDGEDGAAERRWVDLQLPLYRHLFGIALGASFESVQVAYFNLPQALAETGVCVWENYSRELETSALACARGVCAGIAGRCFWPPNPHVRYDVFEGWLSPDAVSVVDAEAFLAALEKGRNG